jgi:hypothetical protein
LEEVLPAVQAGRTWDPPSVEALLPLSFKGGESQVDLGQASYQLVSKGAQRTGLKIAVAIKPLAWRIVPTSKQDASRIDSSCKTIDSRDAMKFATKSKRITPDLISGLTIQVGQPCGLPAPIVGPLGGL